MKTAEADRWALPGPQWSQQCKSSSYFCWQTGGSEICHSGAGAVLHKHSNCSPHDTSLNKKSRLRPKHHFLLDTLIFAYINSKIGILYQCIFSNHNCRKSSSCRMFFHCISWLPLPLYAYTASDLFFLPPVSFHRSIFHSSWNVEHLGV